MSSKKRKKRSSGNRITPRRQTDCEVYHTDGGYAFAVAALSYWESPESDALRQQGFRWAGICFLNETDFRQGPSAAVAFVFAQLQRDAYEAGYSLMSALSHYIADPTEQAGKIQNCLQHALKTAAGKQLLFCGTEGTIGEKMLVEHQEVFTQNGRHRVTEGNSLKDLVPSPEPQPDAGVIAWRKAATQQQQKLMKQWEHWSP